MCGERLRMAALGALAVVSLCGLMLQPVEAKGLEAWLWCGAGWAVSVASGWLALRLTGKWTAQGKLPTVGRYLGED